VVPRQRRERMSMTTLNNGQRTAGGPAALRAENALGGIRSFKETISLVTAALAMSLEGQTRATAGEIAERATRDFQSSATASGAGTAFARLGIKSTSSHGKTRLVLETDELQGIKAVITQKLEDAEAELETVINGFGDLSRNIQKLEQSWEDTVRLRARERELTKQIQLQRSAPSRLPELERGVARLHSETDRVAELEKTCKELSGKIKSFPQLENRQKSLESAIAAHSAREKVIAQDEARLGQALEDVKMRSAWVTYVVLDQNIQRQRAELAEITAQINDRRSLLQKVLGSNKVK
jgi:hypothetical protein